jgi:hypothetical protein
MERKEERMPFGKGRFEPRGAAAALLGFAALAAVFLGRGAGVSAEEPAPPAKIAMRILYAGHPGSAREKDFVEFLGKNFTQVQTGDLAAFNDKSADGFDVMILDWDSQGFNAPRPSLSRDYARATITVGVPGAIIGDQLRLKTGYE